MKTAARLVLVACLGSPFGLVAAKPEPVPEATGFSLIPNAFSKNPLLTMTVFTDVTPYGRTLPAATKEAPVYFAVHDLGMRTMGEELAGQLSPAPEHLQRTLFDALAAGNYQPAPEGKQAGLLLVYYWGSHYAMDRDQVEAFSVVHQQKVMERAMLVGGPAYRRQIRNEIEFGYTFADRTPRKSFLINQISSDLYFVVVSAYDYAELAAGRRKLAWRTTMTVGTNGVAMRDGLPPLIMTAAGYFGHETAEPIAMSRRARRGTVTLGPLYVVADDVSARDRVQPGRRR
jgi:hypothetical protein